MSIKHEGLRTALLISGTGSTATAVVRAVQTGELMGIHPTLLISSKADAPGLTTIPQLDPSLKTVVAERKKFLDSMSYGTFLLTLFAEYNIDLIAQLGWLVKTPSNVTKAYKESFNQHPGPLDPDRPDFGGKGMYGLAVHAALLGYRRLTQNPIPAEATTHRVTPDYDKGEIIRKIDMPLSLCEQVSAEELQNNKGVQKKLLDAAHASQAALLPLEHKNVIATLQDFANGNVPIFQREKPLIPQINIPFLDIAKQVAIGLLS